MKNIFFVGVLGLYVWFIASLYFASRRVDRERIDISTETDRIYAVVHSDLIAQISAADHGAADASEIQRIFLRNTSELSENFDIPVQIDTASVIYFDDSVVRFERSEVPCIYVLARSKNKAIKVIEDVDSATGLHEEVKAFYRR